MCRPIPPGLGDDSGQLFAWPIADAAGGSSELRPLLCYRIGCRASQTRAHRLASMDYSGLPLSLPSSVCLALCQHRLPTSRSADHARSGAAHT